MNVPFINRFAQPPISQLSSLACKTVNFTDQNIKQKRGDPIELNLESLEMQKKKKTSESKHDFYHFKKILTPFFIYSLGYICWFISSLHSKNFKITFQGSAPFALCSGL